MSQSLRILRADTGAELLQSFRAPEFFIPTLALPSAFYLLFGIAITRGGSEVARYLLATYGVFAVMGPALFGFGANVSSEREKGWLMLTQAAPTSGLLYVTSKLLTTLIFAAIALLPIYALAGFVAGVELERGQWVLLFATHLLAVAPFSFIGLTIGFSFGSGGAIAVCNIVFLGLAVLGGLWFPISIFPGVMQNIAQALPSFHIAEVGLWVVGARDDGAPLTHLLIIAIMTAVFAGMALMVWSRKR
ncbi:MAG: ABC transporter permease [Pseudomonadota bacterium]